MTSTFFHPLVLLLVVAWGATTEALDVTSAHNMLAYTPWSTCPTNWVDVTSTYGGRLIKAVNSANGPGNTYGTAFTTDSDPSHQHATWQAKARWPGRCSSCDNVFGWFCGDSNPRSIAGDYDHYIGNGNVMMSTAGSNLPYMSLLLCRYNSGTAINVPTGLVQFFGGSSCPGGTSEYAPAVNRFVVIGKTGGAILSSSPTPAVGNQAAFGSHTHNIAPTTINTGTTGNTGGSGCGTVMSQNVASSFVQSQALSAQVLGVPYIQVMFCEITSGGSSGLWPDREVYFFSSSPTCPGAWEDLTTRGGSYEASAGRLLWTKAPSGSAGSTRGGSRFQQALGTGTSWDADAHTHSAGFSGYNFASRADSDWDGSNNYYATYGGYSFTMYSYGQNENLAPYIVMRGCTAPPPTKSPTQQPSKNPTTSKPSKSPTTSFPTWAPSRNPTVSKPSRSPTHKPSRNPTTSRPSRSPSTSKPSANPTTSVPTLAPSNNPTKSPTPAPQWVSVCTPGDQEIFQNYDNYVIQAGACSDTCQVEMLKSVKDGYACTFKCETLQLYTAICRQCMMDWLACQADGCRSRCAGYTFSDDCVACTNEKCRDQFSTCTGMSGTATAAGGGTGGDKKPPKKDTFPYGPVIGGVMGGIAGAVVLFLVVKRIRERGVTVAMTTGFEEKIFGKNAANKGITEAVDRSEVSSNPMYAHQSRNINTGPTVTGKMLRTRYSFHGTDEDEVDVAAGASLTAIEANDEWYVVKVDDTGAVGCIPKSYVNEV